MQRLLILVGLAACGGTNTGSDVDAAPNSDGGGDDAMPDGMTDGGIVSDCPVGTWCTEDPPAGVTALVHAVTVITANDVFAVGDAGTILRRQDGVWTKMTSNTTANLRGVFALSASDVWAVGGDGAVVHFNGTAWSVVNGAPDIDYRGVWAASANDVWLIGPGSAVHWTGSFTTAVLTGAPVSIAGASANDIWVAAENGKLSHYATSWGLVTTMPANNYYAIAVRTATDVWASTPGTGTTRWNGTTWTDYASGTTLFASIYAPSATNAWGAGGTKVGHFDGTTWTVSTPVTGLANSLYGVAGIGPHTWVVGAGGTLLYHHD